MKFTRFSLMIIFCLIITPLASLAQNANTILILPFDVQAAPKYDYLKPALLDMLFTRLSAPGRTLVVEKRGEQTGVSQSETINLADAIQMGRQRGADYIVTGRISLQDKAVSTNADFIGIAEQRALVNFSQNGSQPGDVIAQIDNFTAQVNADVLNLGDSTDEPTSQSDGPDDIHQHPEKIEIPEIPPDKAADSEPPQVKALPNTQPSDSR